MRRLRVLLLYAQSSANRTLSYQRAWPRHFARHHKLACTPVNVQGNRWQRATGAARTHLGGFHAIVMLHSIFSNACTLAGVLREAVQASRAPKALFIGNEYKLMPEKMAFCQEMGVTLLVSQSNAARVHALYRDRLGCEVIGLPNAGLDPELFAPRRERRERSVDLGYRALDAPYYLGHDERRRISEEFTRAAERHGLRTDFSLRAQDRFEEPAWADFLSRCKGQIGTEAGGDFFELTDRTRLAVNAYLAARPQSTFAEVWERFFANYPDPVPIRILSGRHVEAAGTKTVQLLMEGHYGGYFQPGIHYIALRRDLANVDEAVAMFRNESLADRIAENAYSVAIEQLTYSKLVERFVEALERVL